MNYLYKFFYVFFVYYSKYKIDIPWVRAFCVIAGCIFWLIFSLILVAGLDSSMNKSYSFFLLLLVLLGTIFYLTHFILFKKMMISKEDGKHPIYEFIPTKVDKIKVYAIVLFIFSLPFLAKGLEIYLEGIIFE